VKVGAALDAVESGRGSGTFYRASEGAKRTEWRRSPAVSAPSRRLFSKVKQGERSRRDAELVWGKWRRLAGASIKLRPSKRGATMACGTAALRSGGWRRLGRPREEDDARGGLGWSGRVGRMPLGPVRRENKTKKYRWAARTTGPKWFWAMLRKRKRFFRF
jgi:hypothetical protein